MNRIGCLLGLLSIACGEPSATAPTSPADPANPASPPNPANPSSPESPIGLDSAGCLALVDHHDSSPMLLRGRLVVTYYEPSIEEKLCEWDEETKKHWCPSATATAADCETVEGVTWCPTASPTPEQTGDAQELGLFDLAHPEAGVRRWTNNLVHEAELDISSDGTRVIYAVRPKLDDFETGQGIWIVGIDGQGATRLTPESGYSGIPTWVPGQDAFTYTVDDGVNFGLYRFDLATKTASRIAAEFAGSIMDPETSYDARSIVFKSDLKRANAPDIYLMQSDGKQVRQLSSGYSDHDPVFSPDNRRVYFERFYGKGDWDSYAELDRTEHPEINLWGIVELELESGKERVIIPHDPCGKHFFWLPTVSPDGEQLMFIHDFVDQEKGYQDLWVADRNGGNAQRVPNTKGFYWFDWSK